MSISLKCLSVFAAIALAFVGCNNKPSNENPDGDVRSSNTYAVVVGVGNSKFAGDCPGAELDATRMYDVISQYAANTKLLVNEDATKSAVMNSIRDGVKNGGLFIFYYSGHGGSEPFPDTGVEEDDGRDEFYCFYDTYMRDNDMWNLIKNASGRVMIIADCCHSKTCFRAPVILDFSNQIPLGATTVENGSINLLVWSGCPDDTYSYGSATGGKFTNTILRYFNSGKSYDSLWNEIENDAELQKYEAVQRTIIGSGFGDKQIFR